MLANGKILVVDDTPANLNLLQVILEQRGYDVRCAPNGPAALQIALREKPDLILLDVMMPDMDGYEICRELIEDERIPDVPIIFISVLGDTADKVKGFEMGAVDYIQKPFFDAEVIARVEAHLKVGYFQRELERLNDTLEQQVEARTGELQESEARFRDITANVPGIVYQFKIDATGEPSFPYVSPAIKEILGIEATDTAAEPNTWFDIIFPDDRPGFYASIEESHRTLEPWLWEGRMIRASGKIGWFHGSSTPRKQDDGSVLWTGLVLDITERKCTEAALKEREARLRELQAQLNHVSRLSEMGQISSQIAHELNQPLAAIMNYVQAARRLLEQGRPEDAEHVREIMARAADQTERAGAIIRSLRQFVERGETVSAKADINNILEEANALALVGTGDKGIVAQMELGASLPAVFVDRVQIQQVVVNLVRNAVDAMAASTRRKLTITSDLDRGGHVAVAVADTGAGLSDEVAENLFQPFVTTKTDGIGIGLSLSQTIIKAHGGRLWVEPNPGGGTVFSFTLPLGHEGNQTMPI